MSNKTVSISIAELVLIGLGVAGLVAALIFGLYLLLEDDSPGNTLSPPGGDATPKSDGPSEEEVFRKTQLRVITDILTSEGLKYALGDTAVRVGFDGEKGNPDIVLTLTPMVSTRSICMMLRTFVYVDSSKRDAALAWFNEQHRELVYSRMFIDDDSEIIIDWCVRTTDAGLPDKVLTIPLYSMIGTLNDNYETVMSFGEFKLPD